KKALKNLKGNPLIIVHNAANPLVAEKEIRECVKAAKINGAAYVGHRVADTIHDKNGKTYTRENLIAAQTPQVAYLKDLKKALAPGIEYTDEVQLLEQIGIKAKFVPASKNNFKITTWQDFEYFKYLLGEKITGLGEDTHGFSKEKGLMLGGAKFPKEYKTTANSDGDVILHSLTNAIKSALGLKSLGATADKMFKAGIRDSKKYLKEVLKNLKKKELKITSISISVETNSPKIDPISGKIKQSLRKLTGCKNVGLTALTGNRKTNQIRTTSIVNLTNED
ncbi:2-C-methyl-D-erythritol 2,4-cyclodiphosphate synthase, partial [Patescibacteria group bacterium]|nr:2-C-methyl-D-erythritol 2,4-cyclodiphosphate synthase [Patescibacteria group bacterium]